MGQFILTNKKSQAWGLDFFVGLLIFVFGILSFFIFILNSSDFNDEGLESVSLDSDYIAYAIFSEGYPTNWNEVDVVAIGLLTNNKLDPDKLNKFVNLASSDYEKTKYLFKSSHDYYIEFNPPIILNSTTISGVGKQDFNINNSDFENLIKTDRFVGYEDKFVNVYIYVWGK